MEVKRQYKGLTSYQVRQINREWVVVSSSWNDQIDPRVYNALMTYVVEMKEHDIIVEQLIDNT